jgi:hypothetical protein
MHNKTVIFVIFFFFLSDSMASCIGPVLICARPEIMTMAMQSVLAGLRPHRPSQIAGKERMRVQGDPDEDQAAGDVFFFGGEGEIHVDGLIDIFFFFFPKEKKKRRREEWGIYSKNEENQGKEA